MTKPPPFYPHHWRLAAGIGILVPLYLTALYILPAVAEARERYQVAAELEAVSVSAESLAAQRAQLEARRRSAASLTSIATGDLLSLIDAAAQTHRVRILELTPGPAHAEGPVQTHPATLVLEGDFHALMQFTAEIEASAALLRFLDFQIARSPADSLLRFTARLSLVTAPLSP